MESPSHPRRLGAILSDPQLWVPIAVLIAGILVLVWIA